ncbi:MAG: 16S rRNA (adenine(1518)-N(6)/adenine(1519)-N(6))-dimethyltransferase RsmA [Thermoanaerobaculia bacterium]
MPRWRRRPILKAEKRSPDAPRRLRGPRLKKALGQHHLKEGSLCRPLIDFLFAGLSPEALASTTVIEIGPGGGVLTAELLNTGARVLALEIDPAWAEALQGRLTSARLAVRVGDVLDFDWAALAPGTLVCGNLPYNLGTAIVERVLRAYPAVARAAFLLQREVVDRLAAGPRESDFGSLSLLTQARAKVVRLGIVRPGSFVPPPKVDSAFVGLTLVSPPLAAEAMPAFDRLLRAAFSHRRKTLVNALTRSFSRPRVEEALARLGRTPKTRAEELQLKDFLELLRELQDAAETRDAAVPGDTLSGIGNPEKS